MRASDRRGSDARVGRKAVEKTLSFALRSAHVFSWLCCGDDMCVHYCLESQMLLLDACSGNWKINLEN